MTAKNSRKHRIDFRWRHGRVRMAGYTDKRATAELDRKLKALASCKEAGERPDRELTAWLETQSEGMIKRLGKLGLIDRERVAASSGLLAHLAEYEASMKARGNCARHIRQEVSRIKKILAGCGFRTHSDITARRLQSWLASLRDEKDMSARTVNAYAGALHAFCKWLVPDKASINPLENMPHHNEQTDRRLTRRTLSSEDFARLLHATRHGEAFHSITGPAWSVIFTFAARTGCRWSEIRSLKRQHIDLDMGVLYLEAGSTKNRKDDWLPLNRDLLEVLREWFAENPAMPQAQAFPVPKTDCGARALRFYLEAAGLPFEDESGRRYDFHSLRAQYGSDLARAGVGLAVAQKLMRHSTPTLTSAHYTLLSVEDKRQAVDNLSIPDHSEAIEAAQKTGTDDADSAPEKKWPKLDQILPKRADFGGIDTDSIGQARRERTIDRKREKSPSQNEKACPVGAEQASESWLPRQDLNLEKQNQNLL